MARGVVCMGVLVGVLCGTTTAMAKSRPIQQLPSDVVRWSTLWVAVPEQMIAVGRDDGPLAALTWGPAKGTVALVQHTGRAVWDVVEPDENPVHRARANTPQGVILRYEF